MLLQLCQRLRARCVAPWYCFAVNAGLHGAPQQVLPHRQQIVLRKCACLPVCLPDLLCVHRNHAAAADMVRMWLCRVQRLGCGWAHQQAAQAWLDSSSSSSSCSRGSSTNSTTTSSSCLVTIGSFCARDDVHDLCLPLQPTMHLHMPTASCILRHCSLQYVLSSSSCAAAVHCCLQDPVCLQAQPL
jgi:hypothetical protein